MKGHGGKLFRTDSRRPSEVDRWYAARQAEKARKKAAPVLRPLDEAAAALPQEQQAGSLEGKLATIGIDSTVVHKKFGRGTVVRIDKNEKFIHVRFTLGEKKFIFPDAFAMGFLEVE